MPDNHLLYGTGNLDLEISLDIHVPSGLMSDDGAYLAMNDGTILHDGRGTHCADCGEPGTWRELTTGITYCQGHGHKGT